MSTTFRVNRIQQTVDVDPSKPLLWVIREQLGLTGTKFGCGISQCGACTVHIDGQAVRSCVTPISSVEGREVTTIEGIASADGELHPVQQAMVNYHGSQCGFCTPGFLVSARAFLNENPKPSEQDIRLAIAGNLCRCTGYDKIVRAIQHVAESSN